MMVALVRIRLFRLVLPAMRLQFVHLVMPATRLFLAFTHFHPFPGFHMDYILLGLFESSIGLFRAFIWISELIRLVTYSLFSARLVHLLILCMFYHCIPLAARALFTALSTR